MNLPMDERDWKQVTGLNEETLCAAIESLIFMSDHPISLKKLQNIIHEKIPLEMIRASVLRLQELYMADHHGCALLEIADKFQLRTKQIYSQYVQDLFKVKSLELSPSALEVMAIIAYRQPISKVAIEKIRGVDSTHLIRGLMDKKLIKMGGQSTELGRSLLYKTTVKFLEIFNLQNIDALPPEYQLQELTTESVGELSDVKISDRSKFHFDEREELKQLDLSLKEIKVDSSFLEDLKSNDSIATSSFDLLEDSIEKDKIAKINREAARSSLFIFEKD